MALRAVAEKLEQQSRTQGLNAIAPAVDELKSEFTRAKGELGKLLGQ
jgi:hypothetical protein